MSGRRGRLRDESGVPETPVGVPGDPEWSQGAAQAHLIIRALDGHIKQLLEETRSHAADDHVRTESNRLLYIFGAGFIVLGTMIIGSYLLLNGQISTSVAKMDSKINAVDIAVTRADTKLGDLIARIPPASTPVPRR